MLKETHVLKGNTESNYNLTVISWEEKCMKILGPPNT